MPGEWTDGDRMAYLEGRAKVVRRGAEGWLVMGHVLGEIAYEATLRGAVDAILDARERERAARPVAPTTTEGGEG